MADILATRITLDSKALESGLKRARRSFNQFGADSVRSIGRVSASFANVGGKALLFGSTVTGVFVKMASSLEHSMINVQKTTGLTGKEIERLRKSFLNLSTSVPQSANDLAKIGEVAGQLGVKGVKNIRSFTETIAKVVTVTDFTVEEAAKSLAKLSNLFDLPISEVKKLASAMNELENTTTATAPALTEFMRRIAPSATQLGITASEVAGLSASLIGLGFQAEGAGTAIQKVFLSMITEGQQFSKLMGISFDDFQTSLEQNAMGTLVRFLEIMRNDSPERFIDKLDSLGLRGERVRAVLLGLKDATGDLTTNINNSNKAFAEGVSLQKEFETFMGSTTNQFKLLFDSIKKVAIELGNPLLVPLKNLMRVMRDEITSAEIDNQAFADSVIEGVKIMGKSFLLFLDILKLVFTGIGSIMSKMATMSIMASKVFDSNSRGSEFLKRKLENNFNETKRLLNIQDELKRGEPISRSGVMNTLFPDTKTRFEDLSQQINKLREEREKLSLELTSINQKEILSNNLLEFYDQLDGTFDNLNKGITSVKKGLDSLDTSELKKISSGEISLSIAPPKNLIPEVLKSDTIPALSLPNAEKPFPIFKSQFGKSSTPEKINLIETDITTANRQLAKEQTRLDQRNLLNQLRRKNIVDPDVERKNIPFRNPMDPTQVIQEHLSKMDPRQYSIPVDKMIQLESEKMGEDTSFFEDWKKNYELHKEFLNKKEEGQKLYFSRVKQDAVEYFNFEGRLIDKDTERLKKLGADKQEIERFQNDAMFTLLQETNALILEEEGLKNLTLREMSNETLFEIATGENQLQTKRIEAMTELKSRNLGVIDSLKLGWNEYKNQQISGSQQIADFTLSAFQTMERGLGNAITAMINGTRSFKDSLKGIFDSILQSFISMVAQMIARWLFFKAMSSIGVPGFSTGGMIPGNEDGLFLGRSGEGVLTKEGVAKVGGKAGLELLNSGGSPSLLGVTSQNFLSLTQGFGGSIPTVAVTGPGGGIVNLPMQLVPSSGFEQFGTNAINNLGSFGGAVAGTVGAIGGSLVANELFVPSTASSLGGTAGSMAGSLIAAGAGFGPVGIAVGAFLGAIGGAGIGAAISGKKKLHAGEMSIGNSFLAIQDQNLFSGDRNADFAKNLALARLQNPNEGDDSTGDALHEIAKRINVNVPEQTILGFQQLIAEGHRTRSQIEEGLVQDLSLFKGKFATGGIVHGPAGLAMVAERGPEAIIPLKNGAVPVSFGENGLSETLIKIHNILERFEENGGSEITINLDGEAISENLFERSKSGLNVIHANGVVS